MDKLLHLQTSVTTAIKWAQKSTQVSVVGVSTLVCKVKEPLYSSGQSSRHSGEGELVGCLRVKEASPRGSAATH